LNQPLFLHNPRCSKSRAALALLEQAGIAPAIVNYLEVPPTAAAIERILDLLGIAPRELMRRDEDVYHSEGLADQALGPAELIDAMARHPRLIQRPIFIANGKAVIGRPPAAVLDIL